MGKFTEMFKGWRSPGIWMSGASMESSIERMFEQADMEIALSREEVERLRGLVDQKEKEIRDWRHGRDHWKGEALHVEKQLANVVKQRDAAREEAKAKDGVIEASITDGRRWLSEATRLKQDLGLCKKERDAARLDRDEAIKDRDAARLERDNAFKELDIAHKELESYRGSFEGKAHDLRQSMADMAGAIRKALAIPMGPPPTITEVPLTISQLVEQAHGNAVDKGWYEGETVNFGERLMLIVSEVSEALEDYRNGNGVTGVWYESKEGSKFLSNDAYKSRKPCGIPSELADAVIRIADLCGHYGINLEAAIIEKMAFNKSRPHRHGGKKA